MTASGRITFELDGVPTLSRSTVDRQETLRDDPERLLRMWPTAKVLVVDERGAVAVQADTSALVFRAATEFGSHPPPGAVLLGEAGAVAYWAVRVATAKSEGAAERDTDLGTWRVWERMSASADEQWLDLRGVGAQLGATDAGLLTTAVALLYWHEHAAFCSVCGSPTEPVRAGWQRNCTACGHQEYPRTDPAVIVLVHDGAEHVLLARQPRWPRERYSVLAGFVEAGEAMEATVVREVHEEVGVWVSDVHYLGSQPWPFPRSLMIGFSALADRDQPLRPADGEIEAARWVSKSLVRKAIAEGGMTEGFGLPGGTSIARLMVESWARLDD